jgi:hypothetical protein
VDVLRPLRLLSSVVFRADILCAIIVQLLLSHSQFVVHHCIQQLPGSGLEQLMAVFAAPASALYLPAEADYGCS